MESPSPVAVTTGMEDNPDTRGRMTFSDLHVGAGAGVSVYTCVVSPFALRQISPWKFATAFG